MTQVLLIPLADAFMEVGVFVALMVAVFAWLRWRFGVHLPHMVDRRRLGPLLGALLGVSPGCAGALVVMPLYSQRTVSFGTMIAALVATMGDSSWVIFAAQPVMALKVHAVLFVTGLTAGYVVDHFRFDPTTWQSKPAPTPQPVRVRVVLSQAAAYGYAGGSASRTAVADLLPAPATLDTRPAASPASRLVDSPLALLFWVVSAAAAVVALPVAFHLLPVETLAGLAGGIDLYLLLGGAGAAICVAAALADRDRTAYVDRLKPQAPSVSLVSGAYETAAIVVWVAVVYLAWSLVEWSTGFDGSQLPMHGIVGVFAGVLMLASHRRSAAVATVLTTIPGLIVGAGALFLLS